MKIVRLVAENVKRLQAVDITPKGAMVQVTGRNGQGKSSILDSIWYALAGRDALPGKPIRKGATKAVIKLDLGELRVTRTFKADEDGTYGTSIVVENEKGARYQSPQRMLDALIGSISFDPLEFSRLKAREQYEQLRRIAKVDLDIDTLEGQNRADFDKRTDLNRDAKVARAQADGTLVPPKPAERVDIGGLVTDLQRAANQASDIERTRGQRHQYETLLEGKRQQAERQRRELAALDDDIKSMNETVAGWPALPTPPDTADLRRRIDDGQAVNRANDEYERKKQAKNDAEKRAADLEAQSVDLTATMTAREQAKAQAIEKAEMPVAGLNLGAGIVLLNDVPFDQASTAEQLRVSMAIAMAANPKLRVIRIREGSFLDDDGLALVAQMAAEKDYQVWVERVDSTGKVGVVIEDGSVKADHQEDAPAPAAAPVTEATAQAQLV